MNFVRAITVPVALSALILGASPPAFALSAGDADGPVSTLTYLQPDATTVTNPPPGWSFWNGGGGAVTTAIATPPVSTDTSQYVLEGSYPVSPLSGGEYVSAYFDVLSQVTTEDLYIEFWAKMPSGMGGFKFLKIFGQRLTPTNYADMTFPTDYTGIQPGALAAVYYGDGTQITNDSQNAIFYSGTAISGRSAGIASIQTPQDAMFTAADWGTAWHHFRIHVKFNSGTSSANEVPDGEIYVEVDGKVYLDATGLYDRNPTNGPIQKVEFFGWAQNDAAPYQIWYDDIRITTGGFASQPLPDPPGNVQIK